MLTALNADGSYGGLEVWITAEAREPWTCETCGEIEYVDPQRDKRFFHTCAPEHRRRGEATMHAQPTTRPQGSR